MRDIAFVNNTFNIAKQPRMTAINSCIEIDITGQVRSSVSEAVMAEEVGRRISLSSSPCGTDELRCRSCCSASWKSTTRPADYCLGHPPTSALPPNCHPLLADIFTLRFATSHCASLQVVSDSIGTRVYSGVGGQMDFIRGAGAFAYACIQLHG